MKTAFCVLWVNLSHPAGPRSYFKAAGFLVAFTATAAASWLAHEVGGAGGAGGAGWGRVAEAHPAVNNANANLASRNHLRQTEVHNHPDTHTDHPHSNPHMHFTAF